VAGLGQPLFMQKKYFRYLALFVFLPSLFFSQALVDTLYLKLDRCKTDSCSVRIRNKLVGELLFIDLKMAEGIANDLYRSVNENDIQNFLETQYNYAIINLRIGNVDTAFNVLKRLKIKSKALNNNFYEAKCNYGLAKYYLDKNELKTAIALSFEALREFEKLRDLTFVSNSYAHIALINSNLKNNNKAIDYFKKSLESSIKIRNISNMAFVYNNLGNLYSLDGKTNDIALEYYKRALNYRKQLKHELEIAPILLNIGTIYYDKNELEIARKYFEEALELNLKHKRSKGIAMGYLNIGGIDYDENELKNADYNFREALKYIGDDFRVKELIYYNLGEVNFKLGNYKDALRFSDTCMTIKDSLYSREAIKSLNDMQVKYETEKTKLELEKKDLESKNKQIAIYAALGGCVLLLGLLFFIFRGYKNKEKTNLALEEKNSIITEKSRIVEEQHKDITDSIKYAERIQTAILPPDKLWKQILPESFVFYKPKDILSGDFYWIEETKTHIYIAAADCTGHGVPGALVSIVNYNLLNKAVLEMELTDPAKILDQVNIWLTQALHQSYNEASVRDGMDVALCVINKKTKLMQFAGAFNSGYVIKDHAISELVADKKPVGAFIEDDITLFTSKEYQLTGNEAIYLFTDGMADQFGGPKGKKYKYKNLQNLFLSNQSNNFDTQKQEIQKAFTQWKADYEQTDDVLVIGFKYT